jgi:CPA1 family monovalent cation:H+ antiporter
VAACAHLADLPDTLPEPVPDRCEECASDGSYVWVHLRRCLTCGHVACCDSSDRRHATAHHQATGHAVMRSVEPGESWRWCYVDEAVVG